MRNFFIMSLLFFCFSLNDVSSVGLHARNVEEILTWEDCIREAKENHPDLVSAREKLNQVKANKSITRSAALPQISSSLSKDTSKTANSEKTDTYSYGITGKQLLFDGFKTSSDIASASENIKSAQYNYEVTSSDIMQGLRTAFIKLLKAQHLLNITEDIAKRRKQNVELVKLRYEAGREHKGSLLTAQANMAQAEFEAAQAKRNISTAQRRLTVELGREKLIPIRVKGNFEIECFSRKKPDFEKLAKENPFLKELIARKESARFGLKSARADFFPKVYADADAGRTASDWPPDEDKWSVGISLSFPLFEGGRQIAEVSRAGAVLNQAQADERSGKDSVILTLEETWTDFQDAVGNRKVQNKFLEAAEERAKIAGAQYSTGLISFDNWIIIEDDLVRAKKSFLNSRTNALLTEANWIQAKGETLDYE